MWCCRWRPPTIWFPLGSTSSFAFERHSRHCFWTLQKGCFCCCCPPFVFERILYWWLETYSIWLQVMANLLWLGKKGKSRVFRFLDSVFSKESRYCTVLLSGSFIELSHKGLLEKSLQKGDLAIAANIVLEDSGSLLMATYNIVIKVIILRRWSLAWNPAKTVPSEVFLIWVTNCWVAMSSGSFSPQKEG